METTYSTYAFISYSHRDMAVAKWLQKRLEAFKLPTEIHNDIDAKSRYLRPIFRDQSDLNTGVLGEELRKHLEESKYLILICSSHSARSKWVSDEAEAFVEMGRLNHIIPVIIPDDNIPEKELFPEFLREYFSQNPDKELLGVNIGEVGKEKALIRVVSRMLDVSFDSLWKRHLRQKRNRRLVWSAVTLVALVTAYLFAIPVTVSLNVDPQKSFLPVGEEIKADIDGAEYFSPIANPHFEEIKIPGYKRFSDISVEVSSQFFTPVDTVVVVGWGLKRVINIELLRDDAFAIYAGYVYDSDMNPLDGVRVVVNQLADTTDLNGAFSIRLPLQSQRAEMSVYLEKEGFKTRIEDTTPSKELKLIMHK